MMVYPAIVYKLRDVRTQHADNAPYSQRKRYEVTVMDFDPDNVTKDVIAALPLCSFDRSFVNDNLNHFVFNLYW